jgi:protein gp37
VREWSNRWANNYPFQYPHHRLDWVVAGGESGPNARPMHPSWARSIRDQCAAAGVPFHFKQHGEWAPSSDEVLGDMAHVHAFADGVRVGRFGKKMAGRNLDGVEHNGFPA